MKHRLSVAALLTAVFFLGSCSSASKLVFQKNVIIPADHSGVVHAVRTKTQEEYALLDYLGVNWTLDTFSWYQIEPEQGEWNFTDYDSFVDNANAAGVKMIGLLAYDNRWIHEDNKMHRYISPQRTVDFLQYVKETVEHFRGRIGAWCIWNEPNMSRFWKGTDDEFVELTRHAADAVREVDSEVILLGGSFNRNVLGMPEKFIRKLFENGAMDKADGIAFHPYELNPSRSLTLYNRFRKIVDDYGFGDKIWLTEVGYPTGGLYPTKTSEKRFPEYVIKTYEQHDASGSKKLL
jgi:GH35 family endo-1,4-beta-xylanase